MPPNSLRRMKPRGELAIVLHTHMPYVEGFGTWPFGEEWLWEAIATSYLPLLDLFDPARPAPLTLSLTPVLCDQLEAPAAATAAGCSRRLVRTRVGPPPPPTRCCRCSRPTPVSRSRCRPGSNRTAA